MTIKNPQGGYRACKMLKCLLSDKRQRKFCFVECWYSVHLVYFSPLEQIILAWGFTPILFGKHLY